MQMQALWQSVPGLSHRDYAPSKKVTYLQHKDGDSLGWSKNGEGAGRGQQKGVSSALWCLWATRTILCRSLELVLKRVGGWEWGVSVPFRV